VTLHAALPLTIETGRASFQFVAPAAGAARLSLSLPGEETLVNVSPGLITSRASKNGRTAIEATLAPGQTVNVWWSARLAPAPVAAPKETRFLSDVKTIVSLTEAEVICAALAEVSVVQGEPAQFRVQLPAGFQYTGASGPALQAAEPGGGFVVLRVTSPAARSHQFLITMSRPVAGAALQVPMTTFPGAQRETGEVAVEGEGSIEVKASGAGGLRRMDLKETSEALRAMAHASLHAAFRYQRRAAETPAVSLEWARFPETAVLSAAAQSAVVTTLVTSEGRSLTEVKLTVRNVAQQFLRVALPAGASILSAEVAGVKTKPVEGADGSRVPLLRPGFTPPENYAVSFVFLQTQSPFVKKGTAQFELPKMDMPVGVMEWEVFLPQQYSVSEFGGDPTAAALMTMPETRAPAPAAAATPGQIGGVVTDSAGGSVPNARVTVVHDYLRRTFHATTDPYGRWSIANVPAGRVSVSISSPGFMPESRPVEHDAGRGSAVTVGLRIGGVSENVTVMAESVQAQRNNRQAAAPPDLTASVNVADLQRRVVGVLPIAINVPKAGNSYRFVRALVVDETTRLTFRYRRK
jgi:hypothetical protein